MKKENKFIERDIITGRKLRKNPLNKKKLTDDELDNIMLEN